MVQVFPTVRRSFCIATLYYHNATQFIAGVSIAHLVWRKSYHHVGKHEGIGSDMADMPLRRDRRPASGILPARENPDDCFDEARQNGVDNHRQDRRHIEHRALAANRVGKDALKRCDERRRPAIDQAGKGSIWIGCQQQQHDANKQQCLDDAERQPDELRHGLRDSGH